MTMRANAGRAFADTIALVRRSMLHYQRSPDVVVILLIQPLIVLLLFRYVLGGQVRLPDYVEYLMPGIFVFSVIAGFGNHRHRAGRGRNLGRHRPSPCTAHCAISGSCRASDHRYPEK